MTAIGFALIETALGNVDNAFQHLRRAMTERSPRVAHLKVEPVFDALKTDGRFLTLLEELRIAD